MYEELPYIADLPQLDMSFGEWIKPALIETEVQLPVYHFRYNDIYKDWSFDRDSLFADSGNPPLSEPMEMPDPMWDYGFRDLISEQQCRFLDDWAIKYNQKELKDTDYSFKNSELNIFATVVQFRDLLFSENFIGCEVRSSLVCMSVILIEQYVGKTYLHKYKYLIEYLLLITLQTLIFDIIYYI